MLYIARFEVLHSGFSECSGLLEYDAVLLGQWPPTFGRFHQYVGNHSSNTTASRVKPSRKFGEKYNNFEKQEESKIN
jgi:hypothetical protein